MHRYIWKLYLHVCNVEKLCFWHKVRPPVFENKRVVEEFQGTCIYPSITNSKLLCFLPTVLKCITFDFSVLIITCHFYTSYASHSKLSVDRSLYKRKRLCHRQIITSKWRYNIFWFLGEGRQFRTNIEKSVGDKQSPCLCPLYNQSLPFSKFVIDSNTWNWTAIYASYY